MCTPSDSLTDGSIAERWPRCRGRSSSRVNGIQSYDSSSRRVIRRELSLGSRTSSGSCMYSTYVQLPRSGIRGLTSPLLDGVGNRHKHGGCGDPNEGCRYSIKGYRYPHYGCGYASKHVDGKGRCFLPRSLGRRNLHSIKSSVLTIA